MFKVRSLSPDFGRIATEPLDLLIKHNCQFETVLVKGGRPEELIEAVKGVDALVVGLQRITKEVLEQADCLKVIGRHGVGVDNVDLQAAERIGIPVVYAPGANAQAVADLAVGLMLALSRSIPLADRTTKQGEWMKIVGTEIWGKTLGIFGLGQIGLNVAQRVRGFDMTVIAHDVVQDFSAARRFGVSYESKETVLASSDIITLHLPLLDATRNFISKPELKSMKNTSMLINTSRGGIVNEDALYTGLCEGWIQGAASDVFKTEPPGSNPLLDLDNFIATPHLGGITREGLHRVGMTIAEDMVAVLEGRIPKFPASNSI
jgi:D-3-phosphoglycerate dehydrogenase